MASFFERSRVAWARADAGDFEAVLAMVTPDVLFEPLIGELTGGAIRGREAMSAWLRDFHATFADVRRRFEWIKPVGDGLHVGAGSVRLRARAGDAVFEQPLFVALELRDDGLMCWFSNFATEREARAAIAARRAATAAAERPDQAGA